MHGFAGAVNVALSIHKSIQSGAVDALTAHIKPRGIYPCALKRKIVEIALGFGNDHRWFKACKLLSCVCNFGQSIGCSGAGTQQLIIGAIHTYAHTRQALRCGEAVGKYQNFISAFFGN